MDKPVDIGDNFWLFHCYGLVMLQMLTAGDRRKTVSQVGFCRLFGVVGRGSAGSAGDKLCEKPPKPEGSRSFPPDVSISPFGK